MKDQASKHIVCFHLYNDFSGSPKVLHMALKGLLAKGYTVDLFTSSGGVLDTLKEDENLSRNLNIHHYQYKFSSKAWRTTLRYVRVQIYTFFIALQFLFKGNVVFYINTVLPIGPALAGRLIGKRIVYHYHENSFAKGRIYKTLCYLMQKIAHKIICVSEFQLEHLKKSNRIVVIPNALQDSFVDQLHPDANAAFERKNVLLVASNKAYKGIYEFMSLANKLSQFKFTLVLNSSERTVDVLKSTVKDLAEELTIFPRQTNVAMFYNEKASIVLNLSDKNQFIETFGLTALEAMAAGLPVIVPTIGGISELVEDGINGYCIDVQNLNEIEEKLTEILSDKEFYLKMSANALNKASEYSEEKFISSLSDILNNNHCS